MLGPILLLLNGLTAGVGLGVERFLVPSCSRHQILILINGALPQTSTIWKTNDGEPLLWMHSIKIEFLLWYLANLPLNHDELCLIHWTCWLLKPLVTRLTPPGTTFKIWSHSKIIRLPPRRHHFITLSLSIVFLSLQLGKGNLREGLVEIINQVRWGQPLKLMFALGHERLSPPCRVALRKLLVGVAGDRNAHTRSRCFGVRVTWRGQLAISCLCTQTGWSDHGKRGTFNWLRLCLFRRGWGCTWFFKTL